MSWYDNIPEKLKTSFNFFQCNLELDELDFALMSVMLVTSEKKRNRFPRTVKESLKSQHVSLNPK